MPGLKAGQPAANTKTGHPKAERWDKSMQVPLDLSVRDIPREQWLEDLVNEQVAGLERVCDHISSCRVSIERPQKAQQTGNPYRVRIDINVPPKHEVVVTQEPGDEEMHPDLAGVVRSAFDSAQRQVRELVDRQRHNVKAHDADLERQGTVRKLFLAGGYGFLQTFDNRELYFHRNSVFNCDFNQLKLGTIVRYEEEEGDEGPQASTVHVLQRP